MAQEQQVAAPQKGQKNVQKEREAFNAPSPAEARVGRSQVTGEVPHDDSRDGEILNPGEVNEPAKTKRARELMESLRSQPDDAKIRILEGALQNAPLDGEKKKGKNEKRFYANGNPDEDYELVRNEEKEDGTTMKLERYGVEGGWLYCRTVGATNNPGSMNQTMTFVPDYETP